MSAAAPSPFPHPMAIQLPPQGGAPMPMSPSQPGGEAAFKQAISQLLDDLHKAVALADDPEDRQALIVCLGAVNKIMAAEQKDRDAAMGVTPQIRMMRKAYGG